MSHCWIIVLTCHDEWSDVEHYMSLANTELNLHRSNLILNVITLRSIPVAKYCVHNLYFCLRSIESKINTYLPHQY